MDPKNKIYITWEQVTQAVDNIANKIKADNVQLTHIIGISRGGLIPAVMLSHKLNVPLISQDAWDVNIDFFSVSAAGVLVVDDICDSGETLWPWTSGDFLTAVLHQKHSNIAKVQATYHDTFLDYHELHNWIVYPWEDPEANTIQDYKSTISLEEIKKTSTWVTGHEGRLPLDDQPAFDKAMADAREEGGPWREVVDHGDWSISENDTHYRIDEFGCNCDLYRKNQKRHSATMNIMTRERADQLKDISNLAPITIIENNEKTK